MNHPTEHEYNEILDRCLLRLQAGEALESVLADYPGVSDELRPVLEAMLALWTSRGSDTVPVAAMARSRARLMTVTRQINTMPRPPWWKVRWTLLSGALWRARGAMVPLIILGVFAILLFSGWASAQALPGETFYPVKIAAEQIVLSLASSPADRLERERILDLRRKEEVETLLKREVEQEVYFTGFLTWKPNEGWFIDEIELDMPDVLLPLARELEDRYVFLHADLMPHGKMVVETIEARMYSITGRVTRLESDGLSVGDVWLRIEGDTHITKSLELGQTVRATIIRLREDELAAMKIEVIGPAPTPTRRPASRPAVLPENTQAPQDSESDRFIEPTPPEKQPEENPTAQETFTPEKTAEEGEKPEEEISKTPKPTSSKEVKADPTPEKVKPTRTPKKKD